jgi:DNA uptake protein ComE-like DNA-binding protein
MDINKASAEQLESAFQVDGTRARYLVEHRRKSGPFKNWDEVKQVPGFEDKMVENLLEAGLTIGATTDKGLDVNAASIEDLESVFQMDGERARYLIETRNRLGGFESWEQLKEEAPSFAEGMVQNLQQTGATIGKRRSRH